VPSTRWHSQYPCARFDIAALLSDIYNAYILQQEVDRGKFRIVPFPCQRGCKIRTGPHTAPQNAEFPANVNGLNITASILHLDEIQGALNWVHSSLAQFGSTSHGDDHDHTCILKKFDQHKISTDHKLALLRLVPVERKEHRLHNIVQVQKS